MAPDTMVQAVAANCKKKGGKVSFLLEGVAPWKVCYYFRRRWTCLFDTGASLRTVHWKNHRLNWFHGRSFMAKYLQPVREVRDRTQRDLRDKAA